MRDTLDSIRCAHFARYDRKTNVKTICEQAEQLFRLSVYLSVNGGKFLLQGNSCSGIMPNAVSYRKNRSPLWSTDTANKLKRRI